MGFTIIGVMGPGEQASGQEQQVAYALGQQIAYRGWVVLTGGRKAGVMQAASQGARSEGGLTLGILPDTDLEQVSDAVDIPIVTGMGQGRNVINVLTSHGIIACGLGPGTLSEIALAIKCQKPLVLMLIPPEHLSLFQTLRQAPVPHTADPHQAVTIMKTLLFP